MPESIKSNEFKVPCIVFHEGLRMISSNLVCLKWRGFFSGALILKRTLKRNAVFESSLVIYIAKKINVFMGQDQNDL